MSQLGNDTKSTMSSFVSQGEVVLMPRSMLNDELAEIHSPVTIQHSQFLQQPNALYDMANMIRYLPGNVPEGGGGQGDLAVVAEVGLTD